jgi:hypothetical protein
MTKDELIQQNEALVRLVEDSQAGGLPLESGLLITIILALLGTLLYYWFNKVNKSNAEAVYQITEIQKRELIKDYKLKALGENTVNLKRENDQASIELKKSMSNMSKEMTKLADTQVEAWQAIKENKLNIQNLQAANKFITENYSSSMQELTNVIKKAFKINTDAA